MKRGKLSIILIIVLMVASLLSGGNAYAQEEELPNPGITPDSPVYFLDNWGKGLGMFFAFGSEAKAKKALKYAEERLAETRVMASENRVREMTRAADDYSGFMAMVNKRAEAAASENISERVALATTKHLSVLDRVKDKVPAEAAEAITRAREASVNGQVNALRALAKVKPERAIDINSAAIESRLNRARDKATENVTAEAEEALDYAARLAEIEEEMVAIAQEKGIDIAPIQQRLAQATSNRLEVLAGVYEKVPATAKPAIANAIENSVRKYERAVEKLREQNALGEISEEAPVSQRIREEVKERLRLETSGNVTDNITAQVRVQEKVREQTSNLKPEKPEASLSANKTTDKVSGRNR